MSTWISASAGSQKKRIRKRYLSSDHSFFISEWKKKCLRLHQETLSAISALGLGQQTGISTENLYAPIFNGRLRTVLWPSTRVSMSIRYLNNLGENKFPHRKKSLNSCWRAANSVLSLLPFIAWQHESTKSTGSAGKMSTSTAEPLPSGPAKATAHTAPRSSR